MESKTFSPVTPAQFEKIRTLMLAKGFQFPPGNTGRVASEKVGVELSFSYDGTNALTIQIEKKPMFVPASMIWTEMKKAFDTHVA